jgi:hypothetical protein
MIVYLVCFFAGLIGLLITIGIYIHQQRKGKNGIPGMQVHR